MDYAFILEKRIIAFAFFCLLFVSFFTGTALAGQNDATYILNGIIVTDDTRQAGDDFKKIEPVDTWHNQYTDYANGYRLRYPGNMSVDPYESAVRTVFSNDTTRIEVYYDNFAGTISNAAEYIEYGNRFTADSKNYTVQTDRTFYLNGAKVHLLKWTRHKLARVPDDKNYYTCAEIVKNSQEVYTVFFKSSQPISGEMDILNSFSFFDRQGTARNYKKVTQSQTVMSPETQAFYHKYFGSDSPLRWGIFEPSAPQSMDNLIKLENTLNYKFPVIIRYQSLDERLPVRGLQQAYDYQTYVELTLQTVHSADTANALQAGREGLDNTGIIFAILDGQYDDYFTEYAQSIKAFGHPVIFRLNNEMNGDWCWYSAYYAGKDTELYVALWRYLHTLFANNGVDNVLWVWNPHDVSRPDFKWNHYLMYYPGDEYVDVIGLTGYNNGTYFPGEKWREFDEIYPQLYAEYDNLFAKPFMISEFASNSIGGNKVAWINRTFDQIRQLPKIKIAVWWSGIDYDTNGQPGRIYLLDEDEQTINAFRERLKEYEKQ